ncbi:hypothetical protein HanPI659440_Chr13g0524291 [Helianthus annuus]|nr:hypothetical protein HanPI659440_Chr13g0524291 [Helianthus annuus]
MRVFIVPNDKTALSLTHGRASFRTGVRHRRRSSPFIFLGDALRVRSTVPVARERTVVRILARSCISCRSEFPAETISSNCFGRFSPFFQHAYCFNNIAT